MLSESQILALTTHGYVVVDNVLDQTDLMYTNLMFEGWASGVDQEILDTSRLLKGSQAAHQPFAWHIRTRRKVTDCFEQLYKSKNLISSFACPRFWPADTKKTDFIPWIEVGWHTDLNHHMVDGGYCGYVSGVTNKKAGFVVISGSHIRLPKMPNEQNGWDNIPRDIMIANSKKRTIILKEGQMLLYDARLIYSLLPSDEPTILQPVSYFPEAPTFKKIEAFENQVASVNFPFPFEPVHGVERVANDVNYYGIPSSRINELVYGKKNNIVYF